MEKITFIATVYNEREHIDGFLSSLLQQSKLPDEVIIVDAESTDGTYVFLQVHEAAFKKKSVPYVIIQERCNRARGRNLAIQNASHDIIAVSDAGCIVKKKWLDTIIAPFADPSTAVVAGYYTPGPGSLFQQCLATYTCVMPDKLTEDFLPSSRSVAFRKTAWKKVGGYPQQYDHNEDLIYAYAVKRAGMKIVVEPKALVTWPQKETFPGAARQFFWYARGDGQARYIRPHTPFLFLRYGIAGLLFVIAARVPLVWPWLWAGLALYITLYIIWAIYKNYYYVRKPAACVILPTLQFVADIAVMTGMMIGTMDRMLRSYEKSN